MIKIYPLEWLDTLILQTLNPASITINSFSEHDLSFISEDVLTESKKVQIQIKKEVFSMRKKREIRLLVRRYHSSFTYLLDKMVEYQKSELFANSSLLQIAITIIRSLEELMSFLETRFSNFLSLDERVPLNYLVVSRKELKLKINKVKNKPIVSKEDQKTLEIVIRNFYQSLQTSKGLKSTYRQLIYQKELFKKIDELDLSVERMIIYSALDELLIISNFNSLEYVQCLSERINHNLKSTTNLHERLSELLFYFKEFNQLYSSEKLTFDPCELNIKGALISWFKYEIDYVQKKMELIPNNINEQSTSKSNGKSEPVLDKIECMLSSDQIALILRAGDESRILKAKSMRSVFKTIVPHLSSSQKTNLSYDSMRSKSYMPEERDKEIAIKTLERIIKHIKDY